MTNSDDRETAVAGSSGGSRRETRVAGGIDHETSNFSSQDDNHKVVGFIITYTWKQAGEYFPIKLGKNYIGSGKVGKLPDDPDCDIKVNDARMSSSHAVILCRELRKGGSVQFDLVDQESSNGTYLKDRLIPLSGETIDDNYVKITTGSTVWTLIKTDPKTEKSNEDSN